MCPASAVHVLRVGLQSLHLSAERLVYVRAQSKEDSGGVFFTLWYELEVMFGGSQLTHDVAVHNTFINVRVL